MSAVLPDFAEGPLVGLAEALFDHGQGVPGARIERTLAEVAGHARVSGRKTEALLFAAVLALELLPAFFGFGLRRFSTLPAPERVRFLERLDASRLAIVIALPKALLCLCYFEIPEVLDEIGFDGHRVGGRS